MSKMKQTMLVLTGIAVLSIFGNTTQCIQKKSIIADFTNYKNAAEGYTTAITKEKNRLKTQVKGYQLHESFDKLAADKKLWKAEFPELKRQIDEAFKLDVLGGEYDKQLVQTMYDYLKTRDAEWNKIKYQYGGAECVPREVRELFKFRCENDLKPLVSNALLFSIRWARPGDPFKGLNTASIE